MFFYYTNNHLKVVDYALHPPPIHLDMVQQPTDGPTNVAPSSDEWARDTLRLRSNGHLTRQITNETAAEAAGGRDTS
jgi:hypothetical protein